MVRRSPTLTVFDSAFPIFILIECYLQPLGVTQYRLAKSSNVSPRRINEIVKGSRSVPANTALRLARLFGTSERFWLNLQLNFDLETERDRLGDLLDTEVQAMSERNTTPSGWQAVVLIGNCLTYYFSHWV